MADEKLTKADCLVLLRQAHTRLLAEGETRYPRRADFSEREVVAIKAFFGPWPRALESAGIKPPRDDDRLQRNREKRVRAKQRRNAARRESRYPSGKAAAAAD